MTTLAIGCLLVPLCGPALAQDNADHAQHDMDTGIQFHGILDQFEGRIGAGANAFRWEGHAWIGTDTDKLWLKSEGFALGKGGCRGWTSGSPLQPRDFNLVRRAGGRSQRSRLGHRPAMGRVGFCSPRSS